MSPASRAPEGLLRQRTVLRPGRSAGAKVGDVIRVEGYGDRRVTRVEAHEWTEADIEIWPEEYALGSWIVDVELSHVSAPKDGAKK